MMIFQIGAAARAIGCAALLSLMLSGCVVGPKYHAPKTDAPAVYKESPAQFKDNDDQTWKVAEPADAKLRGKWWEIFNDPELNALEEQLNINNQNIKQYFENYMAARAIVREARSQFFPTVSVGPSIGRSQGSANLGSNAVTNPGNVAGTVTNAQTSTFGLPVDATWTPDLFGRIRNTVRQAQYAAQVSAADLENERLAEQASLAEYFFDIRGQDMLQKIYNDTVEADRKELELVQSQYQLGIANQISVVEAETTLQSAEAGATDVAVARAQYEHAIAVLVGQMASGFTIPVKPMTTAPPPIPIAVPSQLLERRPDVAAAERTMAEANATIGIAYSAYYPQLTLSASGGFQSSDFSRWLSWSSHFWSIGAALSETIFDAGLRRATVQQYVATYNADLANYRQTVLVAFQQAEDGLAEIRILSRGVEQQKQAVASAQTYLKLEEARYQTGIDPYVDVLIAQNTVLSAQLTLNTLQIQEMTYAVALIEALGGGWDTSQLPTPAQVTRKPDRSDTVIQNK